MRFLSQLSDARAGLQVRASTTYICTAGYIKAVTSTRWFLDGQGAVMETVTTLLQRCHLSSLLFLLFIFPWSSEEQTIQIPSPPFTSHLWQEESSKGPVDCAAGLCRCQVSHWVQCTTRDTLNNEIPQLVPPGNKRNNYEIL